MGASWAHRDLDAIIWRNVLDKVLIPMVVSPLIGFLFGLCIMQFINWIFRGSAAREKRVFRHLQIGSACFVALSHGLNDAQKSMGLITLGLFAGGYLTTTEIPVWVIMSCAIVMGLGTGTGGFRIIRTMGFSITRLDTAQGFAAEASASIVILAASFFGMPISSTHVIAGGITGVGTAKGTQFVQWGVPKRLVFAWILTLPGAGLAGGASFALARLFLY